MTTSRWRVVGASVQGTAHQRQSLPCQDAHRYRFLPDDTLLVALADGAGSAARAEEGARVAVEAALDALAMALTSSGALDEQSSQAHIRAAFVRAREALVQSAADSAGPLHEFATTLLCAIATADAVTIGLIGDGVVVVDAGGQLLTASAPPQKGEYANETLFLTQDDALERLAISSLSHGVRAVAFTTDGLLRLALKLPAYTPHAPFFAPLLAFVAQITDETQAQAELADFLRSERVCTRTDDDKTLVIAVRADLPAAAAPPQENV